MIAKFVGWVEARNPATTIGCWVKRPSLRTPHAVIPAKAGIHSWLRICCELISAVGVQKWIPAFAGMTGFVGWAASAHRDVTITNSAWSSRIRYTIVIFVALLGYLVTPVAAQDVREQSTKSITVLCCDYPPIVSVRLDPNPATFLVSLALVVAKSPVIVIPTAKTSTIEIPVAGAMPQETFLTTLQELLRKSGMSKIDLNSSLGYNGYEQKYDVTEFVRDTPWTLELRFHAEISQTNGGVMPSSGVYFRLVRTRDQKAISSGTIASVNSVRGEPNFFTRPYLTPFLVRIGANAVGRETHWLPISAEQLRESFDPKSERDQQIMLEMLNRMSEQTAEKVAERVAFLIANAKP
jgi:hypothetical protein